MARSTWLQGAQIVIPMARCSTQRQSLPNTTNLLDCFFFRLTSSERDVQISRSRGLYSPVWFSIKICRSYVRRYYANWQNRTRISSCNYSSRCLQYNLNINRFWLWWSNELSCMNSSSIRWRWRQRVASIYFGEWCAVEVVQFLV